ncbi:hypothetical protein CSKR_100865 [Clonorchis sinensis]|uniref:Uncharacterized protein n=1 Tax=Clonorchis sinensis TaxID=79923 RepID=A0A419QFY2_CLOSI|nr:hypothetical protein CSKR_100865 [Clonorchis sinensis]
MPIYIDCDMSQQNTPIITSSSGALIDCWPVRRAWQLDCKRFITNRGDIISAGLSGSHVHMFDNNTYMTAL